MTERKPSHIFVYGTLMRRGKSPYAALLQRRARFVGEAWVPGRLYHLGRFPGAVLDQTSKTKIFGEVFSLTTLSLLDALDRYEGCDPEEPEPRLFRREVVEARLVRGGLVDAWTYAFTGNITSRPRISSGCFRLA